LFLLVDIVKQRKESRVKSLVKYLIGCVCFLFALVSNVACSRESDIKTENLRGFGCVKYKELSFLEDNVSAIAFTSETEEKAEVLAGKFLWDLYRGGDIEFLNGIHKTKSGTSFAVVRDGKKIVILCALNSVAIKEVLDRKSISGVCVKTAKCPNWMKAFGWGLYGSGGLENFHDWMARAKARQGIDHHKDHSDLDPRDDYKFLQEMGGMFVDNWMQNQKFDNSDGITSPFVYSRIKLAKDFNIPMAYRVYSSAGEGDYSWFFHRFAEHMEKPAEWMQSGWIRYYLHTPHLSWFDPEIWEYAGARVKQQMDKFGKDGTVRNWMHPAGELAHQPWYDWHSDYSSFAHNAWIKYLQDKGCTIQEVSEMYNRAKSPFKSWSEVPVPEFATFAGLSGMVLDFHGTWQTALPDETVWVDFPNHPGNWDFLSLYLQKDEQAGMVHGDGRHPKQKEYLRKFRRVFSWTPCDSKVYFYFFPMSGETLRHKVSFNGGKVYTVGNWCAIDVTDQLKNGENSLEILLEGSVWNGRAFLSTEKPEMYPNMSMARCKLWSYWHDWRINAKADRCEAIFDAMRQADPNAPIEFMAPMKFGQRITNRLMHDWGGFSHFTGEGVWFFPWYKRYAKLYGYQGTSELAGPYETVAEAQRSSLRVFLAGLDMHKPVFLTQVYSRNPEVRKWWISHKDMLARVGTYDIDLKQPQILIYRRTEILESTFPNPFPAIDEKLKKSLTPWNYDIGRGSLQSIGQSYLYIDDDGIEDGKMDRFKVMVDCGNEIIYEKHVELIKKWVEKGGVFISYPFTGRSTPVKAEAWPMANLTGSIIKENAVRPGYVPKIVFQREGNFFPSFAGQTLHGAQRRLHENDFALQIVNNETVPILTWEDGRIAATARRIGKGMVVHLGSLFWRGAEDVRGIWNPQDEFERTFLRELFAACGQPSAIVETDNRLVLSQPYRSKNGMNLVAVLCNFNETNALNNVAAKGNPNMDVTLKMKTVIKPRRVTAYGGDGVTEASFTFADGVTTVKLPLPMQEVKVVEAECYEPCDILSHWWEVVQEQLHELKKPTLKLAKYDEGKWKDQTQDLKEGWDVSSSDANLKCDGIPLDCLQFWGWPEKKGAVAKKKFDVVDSSWLNNGGKTRLVLGSWVGKNFLSLATVKLNGETLVAKTNFSYMDFDVTSKLKSTDNEIEIVFEDGEKFTGMNGSVFIYNRAKPEFSIDILKGEGKAKLVYGDDGKDVVVIDVPEKWKEEYRVRFYMEGTRDVPKGVKIEDRFTRKHHHNFGNITDIDITSLLKYGKENRIDIGANSPAESKDKTTVKKLTVMRLDFYKK
jgi:hypothetical protein